MLSADLFSFQYLSHHWVQPLQPVNINIVVSNIFHLFLTEIFSGGGLTHGVSSAEDRQRLENSVALSQDSSLSASHPSCFTLSHLSRHPGLDSALPNKLQHQKCRVYIKYQISPQTTLWRPASKVYQCCGSVLPSKLNVLSPR